MLVKSGSLPKYPLKLSVNAFSVSLLEKYKAI
jgi:hypothetical protein